MRNLQWKGFKLNIMLRLCFLLLAASLLVSVNSTIVQQCGSKAPLPLSVEIDGCDEPPCTVYKGSNSVMRMHFVSTKDVSSLNAKAKAFLIGSFGTDYALDDSVANVCNNLLDEAYCPLYATEDVVYNFKLYIETWFPEISTRVEVKLEDTTGDVITCFSVNIKVRSQAS